MNATPQVSACSPGPVYGPQTIQWHRLGHGSSLICGKCGYARMNGCKAPCPGHAPRKRANVPLCHARWSAILPRVPYPEHEDCGGGIRKGGFDFKMDFVSSAQAHTLVNLSGRRASSTAQFFTQ